ncbi:MAG: phosphotransferase family protein [Proteobacteria bacterium]|nr:phosphotransferase family protein [Pseudomonadota bacterium]
MEHPLAPRIAAYVAGKMPDVTDVAVLDVERISGGASRETYRFRLSWREGAQARERRLILRRDPPASLIDTERRVEFEAYRAFHGSAVPVPEMLWLEEADDALDHPFFIAEELSGYQAAPQLLFAGGYDAVLPRVAERKWTILGEIAKADPAALGLTQVMPAPALDACWRRELDHWEAIFDKEMSAKEGAEPQPIARAAIRWLRANPPPPAQKLSVVHGDYRTGNFLYDEAGDIHGVLDWEMAHLGDPLEDLAWGFNPIWRFGRGLAGGLISKPAAVALWEAASGLHCDPKALHWWELFNCVKGQGIWVGSARAFIDGGNREPIMVYPAWWLLNAQDRAILEVMGRL